MKNSPSRLEPDYSWEIQSLTIDTNTDNHPVTVTLKDASGLNWGATRTVRANYVVGCDGAHSSVRKAIGGELHGDAAHQAWGVMDILANTDFPDVRQKCLISSANEGNVLILPREGGYVFRMYVELDKLRPDEKAAHRKFTQDDMIAAANRIIKPYSLDVKEVVWWSIYDIGHSLTDKFDDVPEGVDRNPRVFTAGDACHTHSPKAGQGMNVSMQDTFNLGWKLVHVLQGRADASLLRSYTKERLTEAKRLVETDHAWSRVMSAPTTQAERDGTQEPRIIRQFKENLEFTGGTAVKYDASYLFAASPHQALAKGEEIGRRFHSAPVVRLSDAKQMQLGHVAEADARWRIYAFAGKADSSDAGSAIHKLADWLETQPQLAHRQAHDEKVRTLTLSLISAPSSSKPSNNWLTRTCPRCCDLKPASSVCKTTKKCFVSIIKAWVIFSTCVASTVTQVAWWWCAPINMWRMFCRSMVMRSCRLTLQPSCGDKVRG